MTSPPPTVKQWRYRPTVIDGSPRRVALVEVVDLFPDEGARADYFASMLKDKKEARPYRLLAVERLRTMAAKKKAAMRALEKASDDPDEDVRNAAREALQHVPEVRK